MWMMLKFVIALFITLTAAGGTSLAWPKITSQPRPDALQKVHDLVIKTPWGQQAANVLGVTDESQVEQINISSVASNLVTSAADTAQKKAQEVIMQAATQQFIKQLHDLPPDQQEQIRGAICTP